MAETFYTALGVDTDADGEAIRVAFRERVKENHPDVSDDPGAPREFKRLTTAREVLADADERARYDRLGHETYVERHLETSAWAPTGPTDSGTTGSVTDRRPRWGSAGEPGSSRRADRNGAGSTRHRRTRPPGAGDRFAWLGDDWERPGRSRREQRSGPGSERPPGGAATADWQRASDVYSSTSTAPTQSGSQTGGTTKTVLGSVGPWFVVHLVFVLTAIGTAVYAYASLGAVSRLSIPGIAVGVLLVGLVVTMSALHVVSLLYG